MGSNHAMQAWALSLPGATLSQWILVDPVPLFQRGYAIAKTGILVDTTPLF